MDSDPAWSNGTIEITRSAKCLTSCRHSGFLGSFLCSIAALKKPFAYAVALHGAPRGMMDLDFIVRTEEKVYQEVEDALKSIGLQPRLPVTAREIFQFRKEYIEQRNLIAWSFVNPLSPFEIVDIILTDNLDDYSCVDIQLTSTKIRVISKHDLIRMKQKAGREQDRIDAEALGKLK